MSESETTDNLREIAFATVMWFNDHEPAGLPTGSLTMLRMLWNAACEVRPSDACKSKYALINPDAVVEVRDAI